LIRKTLVILACAFAIACANDADHPANSNASTSAGGQEARQAATPEAQPQAATGGDVVFNFVQPLGQKSIYSMVVDTSAINESPAGEQSVSFKLSSDFATEVTATNPDGTWSVKNTFTNVAVDAIHNGTQVPFPTTMIEGKSFTTTMDRSGQIVKTTQSDLAGGVNLDQVFSQMNVSAMLPKKPVRVGDSWPFEMRQEVPDPTGGASSQIISGTGRLTGVSNNQAQVEYQFSVRIAGTVEGSGPGRGTLSYDLGRARVVSSRSDLEVSGEMRLPNSNRPVKSTTKVSTEMRLRGE
jgi:hypothetical protein